MRQIVSVVIDTEDPEYRINYIPAEIDDTTAKIMLESYHYRVSYDEATNTVCFAD